MDDELVQLATIYETPGFVLLANDDDQTRMGCVGLRSLGTLDGTATAEIRRLFVRPDQRGQGLGQKLLETLMERARVNGFERLVLNTLPEMTSALALYGKLGFKPSKAHVDEPAEGTQYFSLTLD